MTIRENIAFGLRRLEIADAETDRRIDAGPRSGYCQKTHEAFWRPVHHAKFAGYPTCGDVLWRTVRSNMLSHSNVFIVLVNICCEMPPTLRLTRHVAVRDRLAQIIAKLPYHVG